MTVSNEQVTLFKRVFHGRTDVYGTYDPQIGRSWQVKRPVTDQVIRDHLEGRSPYGVYLLDKDHVNAVVADFDQDDCSPPILFCQLAQKWGLKAYIERSKSKGYHVWIFFEDRGVLASKARLVTLGILKSIGMATTEVFPKQDRLSDPTQYGNFINAPLFGGIVAQGRTVFLDEDFEPYRDQWKSLKNFTRTTNSMLDKIIAEQHLQSALPANRLQAKPARLMVTGGLPPCAQQMLDHGVITNQRVACFRLACQLRKIGFSFDKSYRTLFTWAQRNHPSDGKGIIRPDEVRYQVSCAYGGRSYRSCGCEDPAVMPFCDPQCHIRNI